MYKATPLIFTCLFSVCALFAEPLLSSESDLMKYHTMLLKRPASDVIYSRFYEAWLDEKSVDALSEFLVKAAEDGGVADLSVLAKFSLSQGDSIDALDALTRALEIDPESSSIRLDRAKIYARLLDFDAALADLQKIVAAEDASDEETLGTAKRLMGQYYVRIGQIEKAEAIWSELMVANPQDAELMEDMIDLQVSEGMVAAAQATADRLIAMTKDPYQKMLYRLQAAEIQERTLEAEALVQLYSDLIQDVGNDSWLEREILLRIDEALGSAQSAVDAKSTYQSLQERYPQRMVIRQRYAQLLAAAGEVDAAIEAFQAVLKLTPGERLPREAYIAMLRQYNREDEAVAALTALCQDYAKDATLWLALAELQSDVENVEGVSQALERFAALQTDVWSDQLRLAALYDQFGFSEKAGERYAQLLELHPKVIEIVDAYAVWLDAHARRDEALSLWTETATEVDRDGLIRIFRSITSIGANPEAFELLLSRYDTFSTDRLYLQTLCTAAITVDKADLAVDWAKDLITLSDSSIDVNMAIQLALRVVAKAEATESVANALSAKSTPDLRELWYLVKLEEQMGESMRADETLQQIQEREGLMALMAEVSLFSDRKDYASAAAAMAKIIALPEGKKPHYLKEYTMLLERLEDYESALEIVEQWKLLTPGDEAVWMRQADLFVRAEQRDEAIREMRRAAVKFEDQSSVAEKLAELYRGGGQPAEAERIYWRLLDDAKDNNQALSMVAKLAELSRQTGESLKLIQQFDAREKAEPRSVFPLLAKAEIYKVLYNETARLEAIEAATRIDPQNLELLQMLSSVSLQQGEYDQAESALRRALAVDTTDSTQHRLIRYYYELGDLKKGLELQQRAAGKDGLPARELEQTADVLMKSGAWEAALELLGQGKAQYPQDWRIAYLHAISLSELGEADAAYDAWFKLCQRTEGEELLNVAPSLAISNRLQYMSSLTEVLTPEAIELFTMLQLSNETFRYISSQSRRSYGSNQSTGFIALPSTIEELNVMSTLHLGALLADLPNESRDEKLAQLKAAGVANIDFVVEMQGLRYSQNLLADLGRLIREHPHNYDYLALSLVMASFQSNRQTDISEYSPEALKSAFEVFLEDDKAYLAIGTAFILASHPDVDATPWIDRVIDLIEADPELDASNQFPGRSKLLVLLQFAAMSSANNQSSEAVTLSDAQKQRIGQLAEQFYTHESKESGSFNYSKLTAFNFLMQQALEAGDRERYIALLNQEMSRYEEALKANATPYGFSNQNNYFNLQAPTFPPQNSELVPQYLWMFVGLSNLQRVHFSGMNPNGMDSEFSDLKLYESLDAFESPALQLLVAWRGDQYDAAEAVLNQWVKSEPENGMVLRLMAAWHASVKQDPATSLEWLVQAREVPQDAQSRARVDMELVAVGLQLVGEPSEAVDLEAAKTAALRLRRYPYAQTTVLEPALRQLGLTDAADRYLLVPSTPLVAGNSNRSYQRSQAQQNKIKQLVDNGKRDAAVRLMVQEIRLALSQYQQNPYLLSQAVRKVEQYSLGDSVMEAFAPSGSSNTRQLEQYAFLLEAMSRRDEAKAVWQQLVELRPQEEAYLLNAAIASDPAGQATLLQQLVKAPFPAGLAWESVVVRVTNNQNSGKKTEVAALAEALSTYLTLLEPESHSRRNLSFVNYYALSFSSGFHVDSVNFPDLVDPAKQRNNLQKGNELFLEVRETAAKNLAVAMLKHPQTAQQGFTLLNAMQTVSGIESYSAETLETMAISALELSGAYQSPNRANRQQNAWMMFSRQGGRSRGNGPPNSLEPDFYLLSRYVESGKDQALTDLIASVREHDWRKAEELSAFSNLVNADTSQFEEAMATWRKAVNLDRMFAQNPALFNQLIFALKRAQPDRALYDRVGDVLLDLIKTEQYLSSDKQDAVKAYLAALVEKTNRVKAAGQWLHLVTEALLGEDAEDREKVVQNYWQMVQRGHHNYNTPQMTRLNLLRNLLQQLSQDPEFGLMANLASGAANLGVNTYNFRRIGSMLGSEFESSDAIFEWIEKQGLLLELPAIDHFVVATEQDLRESGGESTLNLTNRSGILYEQIFTNFRPNKDLEIDQDALIARLRAVPTGSGAFGAHMIAAYLAGKDDAGKDIIFDLLAEHADVLLQRTREQQLELAFVMSYWFPNFEGRNSEEAQLLQPLAQASRLGLELEAEEYFQLTTFVDYNEYRERERAKALMEAFSQKNLDLSIKVFQHWWSRSQESGPSINTNYPGDANLQNYARQIIREMLRKVEPKETSLQPRAQILATFNQTIPSLVLPLDMSFANDLRDSWRAAVDAMIAEKKKTGETLRHNDALRLILSGDEFANLSAIEQPMAGYGLIQFAYSGLSLNTNERKELLEWALVDDAISETPSLKRYLAIGLSRYLDAKTDGAQALALWEGLLKNEAVPLEIRLGCLNIMMRTMSKFYDEIGFEFLYCDLMKDYIEAGYSTLNYNFRQMLEFADNQVDRVHWKAPLADMAQEIYHAIPNAVVHESDQSQVDQILSKVAFIAAAIGSDAFVDEVFQARGGSLKGDRGMVVCLIRRGMYPYALRYIPEFVETWSGPNNVHFDQALLDKLPGFLELIPDVQRRYFVECYLKTVSDPRDKSKQVSDYLLAARRVALAKRFELVAEIPQGVLLLQALGFSDEVMDSVAPYYEAYLKDQTLVELESLRRSQSTVARTLAMSEKNLMTGWIKYQIKEGSLSFAQVQVESLFGQSYESGYQSFLRDVAKFASEKFLSESEPQSHETKLAYRDLATAILRAYLQDSRYRDNYQEEALLFMLICQSALEQPDQDAFAWFQALPSSERDLIQKSDQSDQALFFESLKVLDDLLGNNWNDRVQRQASIVYLLKDPVIAERMLKDTQSLFKALSYSTRYEYVDVLNAASTALSPEHPLEANLAFLCGVSEDKLEAKYRLKDSSTEWYAHAHTAAVERHPKQIEVAGKASLVLLEKALEANDLEAAQRWLDSTPAEAISPDIEQAYNTLKERFEKAKSQAEAERLATAA